MSSSGQAPNVSMDDLLSSIKSMIEGESSAEANSQVGANLDTGLAGADTSLAGVDALGQANIQGNDALDDGIMDLTQVVSPPPGQVPQGQNPLGQVPQGQNPQGQNPHDQASLGQAAHGQTAEGIAPQAGGPQGQAPVPGVQNPLGQPDMGVGDGFGQPPVQEQQAPDQFAQNSSLDAPAGQNPLFQGQDAGQSAQDAAAKLDDIFSNLDGAAGINSMNEGMGGDIGLPAQNPLDPQAGAVGDTGEQPVVPLDQGAPQFSGGMEGQMPPESGVPHPGFLPDGDGQGAQDQVLQPNPGQVQMGGVQPLAGSNSGEIPSSGDSLGRPEQLGGHDPRLEHEIAMGQALSQADASLNLSNGLADGAQGGQQQMNPQQMQQGQMPHGQAPQGQMRGLPPVQQGGMPQQMHGQNPGQMPVPGQQPVQHMQGGMGHVPQPHPMQGQHPGHQGQMVAQGHMQGAMGMPQMGVPQGGADMLPVPSGFRPVLPAVHGQGDMPAPMGDQLPVEMKNNLEEIVKQLLKPLLRDWLERNLPELLKGVVDEETGKIDPNKW